MSNVPPDKIEIACSCGARLKLPSHAAGKKVRCPKCQATFVAPPPPIESDDLDSLLSEDLSTPYDLAPPEEPPASPRKPAADITRECPRCRGAMPKSAVICTACGYNVETGKTMRTVVSKAPAAVEVARRLAFGAGTFAFGCALSLVGALLGAAVWAGVAIGTNFEIGYIAWGLGILAGLGMSLGYRTQNTRAGIIAACAAILGIFAAKTGIFLYVSYPEIVNLNRAISSIGTERGLEIQRLASHRADLRRRREGMSPYNLRARIDLERHEAMGIAMMSDEGLAQEMELLDEWDAGEKWSDESYVGDYLAYSFASEAQRKADGGGSYSNLNERHQQWPEALQAARIRVEAMPVSDRISAAQEAERVNEERKRVLRIAGHHATLRTMGEGSPAMSRAMIDRLDVEEKKYELLSAEEAQKKVEEIESWEKSEKWSDPDYVRLHLIHSFANEAMEAEPSSSEEPGDDADLFPVISEDLWKEHYNEAVKRVDAMTPDERLQAAKDAEAGIGQRAEATKDVAGSALKFILQEYFGVFDILFGLLAIGSAYKIASGGGGES